MNRVSVEASFFKKMSSMENLVYGAKLYGVTTNEVMSKIDFIFDSIGFDRKRAGEPMIGRVGWVGAGTARSASMVIERPWLVGEQSQHRMHSSGVKINLHIFCLSEKI